MSLPRGGHDLNKGKAEACSDLISERGVSSRLSMVVSWSAVLFNLVSLFDC